MGVRCIRGGAIYFGKVDWRRFSAWGALFLRQYSKRKRYNRLGRGIMGVADEIGVRRVVLTMTKRDRRRYQWQLWVIRALDRRFKHGARIGHSERAMDSRLKKCKRMFSTLRRWFSGGAFARDNMQRA